MELNKIFTQKNNELIINYNGIKTIFIMPSYFNIKEVDDELKILSLIILHYPIDTKLKNYKFKRKSSGDKIGLAFSGGIDSVAAYSLLPKDKLILFHHKRIINGKSLYKHDNALYVINNTNHDVIMIESDLEDIRYHYNKSTGQQLRPGFMNDYSFFGGFILLLDYLNIGYLSTGMMLESTYIEKGYKYRDFHNTDYYENWFNFFKNANIPLFYPCIPCSEILTNKIVNDNKLIAQSCIRGVNGKGCNNCYKCFRKKLLNGIKIKYNKNSEIYKFISKRPLKQGASLIYAMNKYNLDIPELLEYKDIKLNWLINYFDYTLNSIPEEYRSYLKNELNKYTKSIDNSDLLVNFKL